MNSKYLGAAGAAALLIAGLAVGLWPGGNQTYLSEWVVQQDNGSFSHVLMQTSGDAPYASQGLPGVSTAGYPRLAAGPFPGTPAVDAGYAAWTCQVGDAGFDCDPANPPWQCACSSGDNSCQRLQRDGTWATAAKGSIMIAGNWRGNCMPMPCVRIAEVGSDGYQNPVSCF